MNALKTMLYMGVMHGLFTVYLPWQLASRDPWTFDTGVLRLAAFPLWTVGILVILRCSVDIMRQGGGTPAHLDPPRLLIVNGLYRHVRNPIYLGALLVQLGTIAWWGSVVLIAYFLAFLVAFHLLIVLIEEPILRNRFGAAYNEYHRNVPRWLPKFVAS